MSLWCVCFKPICNLRAGPEFYMAFLANGFEHAAKIFQPVRGAHDVGMQDQRHDARRLRGVGVDLLELIERPVSVF